MPVTPRKATTVILLRDSPSAPEVFLLKRHEQTSFMAGNYVYPGGRVDQEDRTVAIPGLNAEEAAYRISAVRELFEEAGVLLARTGTTLIRLADAVFERFAGYRSLMNEGRLAFRDVIAREGLALAVDELVPYAHWITPEARSIRFDTLFFLARMPFMQQASPDRTETTDGVWCTAQHAIDENLRGRMPLSPPTLKTLEDLSGFVALDDLFRAAAGRTINPVLPVLLTLDRVAMLVFPWDPEYEQARKGALKGPLRPGRPSVPGDRTTRLIFRDGRWLPYCRTE